MTHKPAVGAAGCGRRVSERVQRRSYIATATSRPPVSRARPWHFAQPRRDVTVEDLFGEVPNAVLREHLAGAE
jgi:hypothetical protein